MHGNEEDIYGNTGYQIIVKRHELAGHATTFQAAMRPGKSRALLDTAEGRLEILAETGKAHHPLKSGAPIQGDQAAICLSENQAEDHDQKSL